MKKCNYCGKEISYHEIYCNDDCQRKANQFYETREKFEKPFSIINCIAMFGIPVGLFMMPLIGSGGAFIVLVCCFILGVLLLIFPFPTENMIKKRRIKNAVFVTRLLSIILFVFGICVVLFNYFFM